MLVGASHILHNGRLSKKLRATRSHISSLKGNRMTEYLSSYQSTTSNYLDEVAQKEKYRLYGYDKFDLYSG